MNLIVGNTSQISYYFPRDYERISSRDIDYSKFKNKIYDRIYLTFGENRTFIEKDNDDIFIKTNVYYTIDQIKFFAPKCKYLVVYGTSELWNAYEGPVNINMQFSYDETPYIKSKAFLMQHINNLRKEGYDNIIVIHPFNFNSFHRKGDFLFGKIFDSILNKKTIEIGNTYFYRDIIHPNYVVKRSVLATKDELVGSGRLIFVNEFIHKLYDYFNMNYDVYVTENSQNNLHIKRKIYYLDSKEVLYSTLYEDTIFDLQFNSKNYE
jgi:hypothetical protein